MPAPPAQPRRYTPPAAPDFFARVPVSVARCATLTPTHKIVYAVLLSYATADGAAWPGQARLAAEVGCSVRTLRTILHDLGATGLITPHRRGQGLTTVYHVRQVPLRGATAASSDRQRVPFKSGTARRSKAAAVAAESDRTEGDPHEGDQPPPTPSLQATDAGGGEMSPKFIPMEHVAADADLIRRATGMDQASAQAVAAEASTAGHGPGYIPELVAHIESAPGVTNPAGCLRALVARGERRAPRPPRRPSSPSAYPPAHNPAHYRPGGKYAHLFQGAVDRAPGTESPDGPPGTRAPETAAWEAEPVPPAAAPGDPSPVLGPPEDRRRRDLPSAFDIQQAQLAAGGRVAVAWPRGQPER